MGYKSNENAIQPLHAAIALCASLLGGVNASTVMAQTSASAAETNASGGERVLEEVIVSARFREESVQDIGASVAAFDSDGLAIRGVVDFDDLSRSVAGLNNVRGAANNNDLAIRGLSNALGPLRTAFQSSNLFSIYYDDVPVTSIASGQRDFNSFDLNRIEVIRGPQPTLFGEGAVGGVIRYFSQDPDLDGDGISGSVRGSYETITDGDVAYRTEGSASIPLIPGKLGLSVTGFYRDDGGFIDNPAAGVDDANGFETVGGRAVLLARPTDELEMRFFTYISRDDIDESNQIDVGSDTSDPVFSATPIIGQTTDDYDLYGARITYDFGDLEVSSITGYSDRQRAVRQFSNGNTLFLQPFFDSITLAVFSESMTPEQSFSQEFRFVSQYDGPLNFTAGLFYQERDTEVVSDITDASLDRVTSPSTNSFSILKLNSSTEEFSGFFELTYELTDRIRLIGGTRYVDKTVNSTIVENVTTDSSAFFSGLGPFNEANPIGLVDPAAVLDATGLGRDFEFSLSRFLPRGGIEFDMSDNALLYANVAVGARNGGLNQPTSAYTAASILAAQEGVTPGTDPERFGEIFGQTIAFDTDDVLSIDAGVKSTWMDGALTINAGVFHTTYEDTQMLAVIGAAATVNGPEQRIMGLELESSYAINPYLTTFLAFTLLDSEFQEDFAVVPSLKKGNEAINAPGETASLGFNFDYPLRSGNLALVANGYFNYIGSRYSSNENVDFSELNSISDLGLSVGLASERWALRGYVRNALNDVEVVGVFTGSRGAGTLPFPGATTVNRPRSYGLELSLNF